MRRPRAKTLRLAAVIAASATTAACGISSAATSTDSLTSGPTGAPILVGISLPLGGNANSNPFQSDGQACLKGYELWASDVNSHGGLRGHPVRLKILDDKGDPNKDAANYKTLITQDHVNLTLAPFSSLLTSQGAAPVTNKYGYALAAGSAGAPAVYALNYRTLFSTNVPVKFQMVPFAKWVLGLKGHPLTAAYPMVNDPFADPPVQATEKTFEANGITTVYHVPGNPQSPNAGYNPNSKPAALANDARQVARSHAGIVVLGSVDPPTVEAFARVFQQMNYTPKIFIAAAGPDQGQAFLDTVGTGNALGFMVPNGWFGGYSNALSHVMVQSYIAKYGGTASDINADVAESYSAGQIMADAVQAKGVAADGSVNQQAIIGWLHTHEIPTVLGNVRFAADGENLDAQDAAVIYQWQAGPGGAGAPRFVQVLGNVGHNLPPVFPKPAWSGG